MTDRTAAYKSDAELICEAFHDNFGKYSSEPLIIYGIGIMTKAVLDAFPWCNVVGLMDETRAGEWIYGKPILSETDVLKLDVKRIVIIATANNTNIIFHRISRFCQNHNIKVYCIDGRQLSAGDHAGKNIKKYNNITWEHLKEKIDASDVVSFDVFDTLIMRRVLYPRDIFHMVEKRTGVSGFYNARIKAENEMCPGACIRRIYGGVSELLKISDAEGDRLLNTEIAIEKECIIVRESMKRAFSYALSSGRRVFLVSDMYIPGVLLSEILRDKDIVLPMENILVSCDFHVGKADGLFSVLRDRAGKGKILHVGDNKAVDIDSATRYGIDDTFFVPSAYEMLLDSSMSELLDITQKLSDRLMIGRFISVQLNDPFLFGRTGGRMDVADHVGLGSFFAPIILGYLAWLDFQVRSERFDYLFCSARDGWLLKKLIEENPGLRRRFPPLVYYYTSRKTAMRVILQNENDIREVLKIKHSGNGLDILKRNFRLAPEEILPYNGEEQEDYIIRHQQAILEKGACTREHCMTYLCSLHIPERAKIGYIDFASSGTTQLGLSKISDFDIKGLYFLRLGGREFIKEKDSLNIASFFERQSFYYFKSRLLNYYTELENILTSYEPTVEDFDQDGNPVFAEERRSPVFFSMLKEIHQSIMEYCGQFELDLFSDCTPEVSEMIFSYLHEDYSIQRAGYFDVNYVYDDVPDRVWHIFGNQAENGT